MASQGRAQGDHLAGLVDQPAQALGRDLGGRVGGQGGQHGRLVLGQDGVDHGRRQLRAAGDLDLVLQRGLDQQADQVVVLQDRAAGDDRAGDLDLVQRQDVDQGRRRPGGVGQALGQAGADVALGLDHQGHEDRVEQDLDFGRGRDGGGLAGVAHLRSWRWTRGPRARARSCSM
jgi:hypothetical protein